jgi:cell wall-associated NlpC family hydrolase
VPRDLAVTIGRVDEEGLRVRSALKRRGLVLVAATAALVVSGTTLVPAALATNVADAEAEAERIGREVAEATEDFNDAEAQLATLDEQLVVAQAREADQQRLIASLKGEMGVVAVEAFKGGGIDPSLRMLTADPLAYLENAALLDSISSSQAGTMKRFSEALAQLAQDQATVVAKKAEVEELTQTLAARTADIERQLADAEAVLAEARRIEQQRAAAALAASRSRTQPTGEGPGGSAAAVPVGTSCNDVAIQAPNARAAAAIDFACAQLGKPYQWGAEGPGSYDCSGLTSAAYAAAGVSIPRSSRAQYSAGPRVSNIQPGDLVFFAGGSSVSHVGIAIGNDLMIDAYRTGKPVEIRSISRLSQYLNYVGATRP